MPFGGFIAAERVASSVIIKAAVRDDAPALYVEGGHRIAAMHHVLLSRITCDLPEHYRGPAF